VKKVGIKHLRRIKRYLEKHGSASPWELKNKTKSSWYSVKEALAYLVRDEKSVRVAGKASRNPNGVVYELRNGKPTDEQEG
jgi:hypothetical protein